MGYLNSVGKGDCEIKGCDKRVIISSQLCKGQRQSYMQGRQPTHAHFFDFKVGNTEPNPTLGHAALVLFAGGMQDFQGPQIRSCVILILFPARICISS